MGCSEKDTSVCLVLADDVGGGGGGEDSVLANDELRDAVRRTNLQNGLDGLGGEVATVSADDDGLPLCIDRVKDGLDKVLCVVLAIVCGEMAVDERAVALPLPPAGRPSPAS